MESHILPIWENMLEPRREVWLPHASSMNRSAGAAKCFKAGNSDPVSEVSAGNCKACSMEPFPSASLMKSEQLVPLAETYFWQEHMHLIKTALPFKEGERGFFHTRKTRKMFVCPPFGMNRELFRSLREEIKRSSPLLKQAKVDS